MTATGSAGPVGRSGRLELLLDVAADRDRDDDRDGRADEPDDSAVVEIDLVARRTRDEEFSAFMRDARDPLHRMAYLLCGDRHRAEAHTQPALARTYRAWPRARDRARYVRSSACWPTCWRTHCATPTPGATYACRQRACLPVCS